MHRYRPYASSSSKATPTTRCQKCLKQGHYSYECKASTQERPYISRPSRTQQLFNPKLQPKLTEAVPPEEPSLIERKGLADSILRQKQAERGGRGRKRRRNGSTSPVRDRSRSSSVSSYSSYSSISSGRSPSPPRRSRDAHSRTRSDKHSSRSPEHERSVRRKYRASPSPARRGRRLSPTDYSRRTRSASRPRRMSNRKASRSPGRHENAGRRDPATPPLRERSPSPFTRRRLLTEAMQRGG